MATKVDFAQLWKTAASNPKTTTAGGLTFVGACLGVAYYLADAYLEHKPLDTANFLLCATVVFTALVHFVGMALAQDSSSSALRVIAKLLPGSEEDKIAQSLAKTVTDVSAQAVKDVERPAVKPKG